MARKWSLFYPSIQSFLRKWKRAWKIQRFQQCFILTLISLLLTLNFSPALSQTSYLNESEIERLQQQSQAYYEQGELLKAAEQLQELINQLTNQAENQQNLAIAWTNLGTIQLAVGNAESALKSWQNASQIYTKLHQQNERLRLQIYQARAWQKLGHYFQSCDILTQVIEVANTLCRNQEFNQDILVKKIEANKALDSWPIQLAAWHSLGDNFRLIGRLKTSRIILNQLSEISFNAQLHSIQLSLGNTLRAMGNLERDRQTAPKYKYLPWHYEIISLSPKIRQDFYEPALTAYQQASQSSSIITQMNARLNQVSLLIELGKWPAAKTLLKAIDLTALSSGQSKIFSEINYAKNIAYIAQQENLSIEEQIKRVIPLLEQAKQEAEALIKREDSTLAHQSTNNQSLLSVVLGNLGEFYESISWQIEQQNLKRINSQDYREKALWLTQEALYHAQPTIAPHIAYQWQWQMGRLLMTKGDKMQAIAFYELAVKTLETVRRDLLTINSDVQFSFRDNVEPLYRQLISLLISTADNLENNQSILSKSIYYIETLQLAELENFLQCNLTETRSLSLTQQAEKLNQQIEQVLAIDKTATLLYPIILEKQIVIIVKRPNQPLRYYHSEVAYQEVEKTVTNLQTYLTQPDRLRDIQTLSAQLYTWLIQPLEKELERAVNREDSQVKTLVFILDTSLRNIPMSVLYDKQQRQYLLERYSLALNPSSQLLKLGNSQRNLSSLLGGLSQEITIQKKRYPALENVLNEFQQIQAVTPSSVELLNQSFTKTNLEQQLLEHDFPIIHLATHGQFSSNPEETFIILYDTRLEEQNLTRLLANNQTVELLVLNACETATGDKRAVLGLAGVAIRAEALSTLATLWQVNDESTAVFMSDFYHFLAENPQMSKAEALRQTQLQLLKRQQNLWDRPLFWAAYVLVGNWL